MISKNIYENLCAFGKSREGDYKTHSGLHKHHIIPKHAGGDDNQCNITYLSVREHIIAHYLLYRINKHPNDLRAMKMLGANLAPAQRKIIGIYCRDNKIGFHGATQEQRNIWAKKGLDVQKSSNNDNSFYFWSTREGRVKRARMGGDASYAANNNQAFKDQMGSFKDTTKASAAAKKSGKHPVTNGVVTRKFHTKEQVNLFLQNNTNWRAGSHWLAPDATGNTHRRKAVTDGALIFEALLHAAHHYKVSSATIINWIKSSKKPMWHYVSL